MPSGEEAEICITGPSLMKRYVNAEDQPISNGWLRTGDLGRFDDDGYLSITGRVKEIIIRGGENLSPSIIEQAIGTHPGVQACCVIGVPDSDLGEVPVAFVVSAEKTGATKQMLIELVADRLSRRHVPADIIFVKELPENKTGKIDRRGLRKLIEL